MSDEAKIYPPPLVPADCDLRDFAFMPVDVARLRDSDLASLESPESCWAAVLLWCASWHQVPAASLPDDDRVLSNLAGYGRVVKEWLRVKDGAMRGWVKCDDGRLYHSVVAEKAIEAWNSKLKHAYEKLCERTRKENKRRVEIGANTLKIISFDDWISAGKPSEIRAPSAGIPPESTMFSGGKSEPSAGIPPEIVLTGTGTGTGISKPCAESPSPQFQAKFGKSPSRDDFPDPPSEPAVWFAFFNREHGCQFNASSIHDRKLLWPMFTRWCGAGITLAQMSAAIEQAHATAKSPIANLPAYCDRVLVSMQRPPPAGGKQAIRNNYARQAAEAREKGGENEWHVGSAERDITGESARIA